MPSWSSLQQPVNWGSPFLDVVPANSALGVGRQAEKAAVADNFCKLQSWQICQKHFAIELSLEITDPNGT